MLLIETMIDYSVEFTLAMPLSQLFEVLFDSSVCCQISDILNSKSQKQVCQKEGYSVAELTDIQNELR